MSLRLTKCEQALDAAIENIKNLNIIIMKRMIWIFTLLLTSFVWVSCDDDSDDNENFGEDERSYVQLAAQSNFNEITLSELALSQGRDSLVRAFAQQMIDDHNAAQSELQAIANNNSVAGWPNELSAAQQSFYDSLSEMEGFEFDTEFMNSQIQLHHNAADVHEDGTDSDNAEIQSYANKHLSKVQEHLQMAESITGMLPQRWEDDQSNGDLDGDGMVDGDSGGDGDGSGDGDGDGS
jgi:putative membrane protein